MTATRRPNIVMILTDDHAAHAIGAYGSVVNTHAAHRRDRGSRRAVRQLLRDELAVLAEPGVDPHRHLQPRQRRHDARHADRREPADVRHRSCARPATARRSSASGTWASGDGPRPAGLRLLGRRSSTRASTTTRASSPPTGCASSRATRPTSSPTSRLDWVESPRAATTRGACSSTTRRRTGRGSPTRRTPDACTPTADPGARDVHRRLRDPHPTRPAGRPCAIADHLNAEDLKQPTRPTGSRYDDEALWKYQRYMEDYLRCVASVDDNVGRVIDWLRERGDFDDTLLMYSSDQGFFLGDHGWFDKRFMYEESIRMPLRAVSYPRAVAGRRRARRHRHQRRLRRRPCSTRPACRRTRGCRAAASGPTSRTRPRRSRRPTGFYYRYWEHDDALPQGARALRLPHRTGTSSSTSTTTVSGCPAARTVHVSARSGSSTTSSADPEELRQRRRRPGVRRGVRADAGRALAGAGGRG